MSLKMFSLLIFLSTILAWTAWGMIISYFNPEQAGAVVFTAFYLSLFLALGGSFYLMADWFKSKIFRRQLLLPRLRTSVRHAALFSLLMVVWAALKSQGLISWWVLGFLVLIMTVLEFFFISQKNARQTPTA